MTLLGRALAGAERRSVASGLATPQPWMTEAFGGTATYSGRVVNEHTALGLVPVYSAVSLLAGAVGSLPLMVYRKTPDGRQRADNHWLWRLLHEQPNAAMAADELWEIVTAHLLLWGNAFLAKVRNPGSPYPVDELWPIRPERVSVGVDDHGDRFFALDGRDKYGPEDILHIRFLGTDGVVGLSPVQQAKQMLASSMDQEEFIGRFYANNAWLGGVLMHPNKLSPEASKNLSSSWRNKFGGVNRAGETPILEEGMSFERVGLPLADAQFIETARFNLTQIALLFRIPPKMLAAATGDSLTYTSSEWESLDFVRWSLRRILVRLEGATKHDVTLFPQPSMYPEFLVEAMLRGTSKERAEFYAIALDPAKGWMRRDEVRELENLPGESPDQIPQPAPAPAVPPAVASRDRPALPAGDLQDIEFPSDADLIPLLNGGARRDR